MITLVLGGARSGKSRYAEALARKAGSSVVFLATAQPCDEEMVAKIERHRQERPSSWKTVETPLREEVERAVADHGSTGAFLVIDCLTTLTANLMLSEAENRDRVLAHIERICNALKESSASIAIVSNEAGCGLVPEYAMGRTFRDLLGEFNQLVAQIADNVVLMVAGYPLAVKGRIEVSGDDLHMERATAEAGSNGVRR